jgi:uncharacterized membrane protein YfcA
LLEHVDAVYTEHLLSVANTVESLESLLCKLAVVQMCNANNTYPYTLLQIDRYYQRGLVDARAAAPFVAASVPACLIGAHFATSCDERVLKAIYSLLMLSLSAFLVLERDEDIPNATDADKETDASEYGAEECIIDEDEM